MKLNIKNNKAQCLICGDIVESRRVHDFVMCSCGNLSVDGGREYTRRAFQDSSMYKELTEYEDT